LGRRSFWPPNPTSEYAVELWFQECGQRGQGINGSKESGGGGVHLRWCPSENSRRGVNRGRWLWARGDPWDSGGAKARLWWGLGAAELCGHAEQGSGAGRSGAGELGLRAAAAGRGGVRERARARLRRVGRGSRRARGGKRSPVISPAVSARLRGAGKGRRGEVLTGGAARSVAGGDARGESLGWASGGDAGRAGCGLSAGPRGNGPG
jgi:hypothetical protein